MDKKIANLTELQKRELKLIRKSNLFDKQWYTATYPEAALLGVDPVYHYWSEGWRKRYNPSRYFDGSGYLDDNPDVEAAGVCPLVHYLYCKANKKQGKGSVMLSIKRPGIWERYFASFKTPRFSVIVASYNYSGFIVETLNSLLEQTYRNFEIIVVDDGSKDNSIEVIRQYMDEYPELIRLYTHEGNANKGLPETVKLGLSKCRGDYVCFCESDDYWTPNHLEELAFVIRTWKNAAMIANNIEFEGDATPEKKRYIKHCRDIVSSNVQKIHVFETLSNPVPSFSACCVKRDILEKCDFNTPVAAWLDWWLWRQILVEHPLHYIIQRTTYWRIHETSYNSKETEPDVDVMDRLQRFAAASNMYILNKLYSRKNGHLPFRKSKISGYSECLHSILFDEKHYRETHMQDCMQNMDAVLHYVLVGWRLGYNPSPYFSTKKYLIRRPDVDSAGINPLVHYDSSGRIEMPGDSFPVANTYSFHEPDGFDRESFTKARNKVLLVSHMLNYTGAPMLLMNVADVLRASGCHVSILCSQDGVLRAELLNRGIPVIVDDGVFCEHDGYKRYVEEGYAFCLVNTVFSYGALCVFKDHIPCAWWIHENIKNGSAMNHTIRKLFATFKNIYVPSELTKSHLEPYCGDLRILTYPVKDSVGDAFVSKKETDVLRCAVVASYNNRKAQDVLIKALVLLSKTQNAHIHVRLFGGKTSSGYTVYLQNLSKDLPNIVFEQSVHDRAKYHAIYEDIDVLICPSREDPYPLVVIDALMHGCPVVLSDHVGQKDLIENGKNGYVFESENPQDLAEKLGKMIDNKNGLPAMSLAARELYLKSFDYAACSKAFLHMVEEACKSK